jgi:transposase-like protein
MHVLYLCILGLRFWSTKAIEPFEEKSHVAVWKWIQRFRPNKIYVRKRVAGFVIDETMIQIGNVVAWLWIDIEPINRTVLGRYISRDRTTLMAEVPENFDKGLW